jgi:hypothetical protein
MMVGKSHFVMAVWPPVVDSHLVVRKCHLVAWTFVAAMTAVAEMPMRPPHAVLQLIKCIKLCCRRIKFSYRVILGGSHTGSCNHPPSSEHS